MCLLREELEQPLDGFNLARQVVSSLVTGTRITPRDQADDGRTAARSVER